MFLSLLRFEALYQAKQGAFILFSGVFFAFGTLLGGKGYSLANIDFNAAYNIHYNTALASLGCVFAIMFFVITAILREQTHNMEAIIYATPIPKSTFFISRFFTAFITSTLAFGVFLLGFYVGTLSPTLDAAHLAPFSLWVYVWTFITIVLPNVFVCTAIVFSVAVLSRNRLATYTSAVLIYALYWVCSIYFNSPLLVNSTASTYENLWLGALADPFGLSAFFEQTQYWTAYEKNTQLIALKGYFLWNRVLWCTLAGLLLLGAYFTFALKPKKKKATKKDLAIQDKNKEHAIIKPSSVQLAFNRKWSWQTYRSLLKIELVNVFKSLSFVATLLLWIIIVSTEIYSRIHQGGAYNDSLYPYTALLIWLIEEPLMLLSIFLIVFYSGEIIWRERQLAFNGIVDALPVSNVINYLAKATSLFLLPMVLLSVSILIAIVFQLLWTYYDIDLAQYAAMFYFNGMRVLLYLMLAFFIQTMSPNKYLGMGITALIICLFSTSFAARLGIEHPMLYLFKLPAVSYNAFLDYGKAAQVFHLFAAYWLPLGLLLLLLSFQFWQRGTYDSLAVRLKKWRSTNHKKGAYYLFFILCFVLMGAMLFYQSNIVNQYESRTTALDRRADYEKRYKQYEHLPRLMPIAVKAAVDLFPHQGALHIKGDYILKNTYKQSIDEVLLSAKVPLDSFYLEGAQLQFWDSIHQVYLFKFEKAIAPQQELKCFYALKYQKSMLDPSVDLVKNGTYINLNSYAPSWAYRSSLEINDAYERKQRNLAEQEKLTITDAHLQEDENQVFEKIDFETTVSTVASQIALSVGDLQKQWTANGRNYYHYRSPVKIVPAIKYISASYQVDELDYQGIKISHYYLPEHNRNNENIINSTKQTLAYMQQHFGAYPFEALRIAEIPDHWRFGGEARPGLIAMVEDRLYLIDNRGEGFDLISKRTIHEVAHQWWGMLLSPKATEGAVLFTEGLTKYTEALLMEEMDGKAALWQLGQTANQRYFSGRAYENDQEPPLYHVAGENYLAYGKSYTVMQALADLVGTVELNAIIKRLFDQYKGSTRLTSLDFLNELYATVPKSEHKLIDDWMKRVITYDLKLEQTACVDNEDGTYDIHLKVNAQRFETQADGSEQAIPIQEAIPIAVLAKHPREAKTVLSMQNYALSSAQTSIVLQVDNRAKYILIDPYVSRSDKNQLDNILEIELNTN